MIRDDKDYAAHMDYLHFNPVKHGFVEYVGWRMKVIVSFGGWRRLIRPTALNQGFFNTPAMS